MSDPVTSAEALAELILKAAGSGLRHYTLRSKGEIIKAAEAAIKMIRETAA